MLLLLLLLLLLLVVVVVVLLLDDVDVDVDVAVGGVVVIAMVEDLRIEVMKAESVFEIAPADPSISRAILLYSARVTRGGLSPPLWPWL